MILFQTKNFDQIVNLKATSGVNPMEGKRLAFLASQVPDGGVIVEIGSCHGRSAAYIASALQEMGIQDVTFYAVDLWDLGVGRTPERHHSPGAFRRFKSNLKRLGVWHLVKPVKADSLEAARKFSKQRREIDLLYIDGGHKYEEVLLDFQTWGPFVKTGGMIVFHDYNHADIARMVDNVVKPSWKWDEFVVCERLISAVRRSM